MLINVSGKVIVITGASKGIGRNLALAFAKEGAKVTVNYHKSVDSAKQLFEEINKYNEDCLLVQADVSNCSDVEKMYDAVLKKYKRIDVLINNAGICDDSDVNTMTIKQWRNVIDVNLTGTYICCKKFVSAMISQNYGKIINIASLKGQIGSTNQSNYAASKAGVISLTKSLSKELGKYNIAVNAICPGFIITDLNRDNIIKVYNAQDQSVITTEHSLSDLVNFIVFMSSDSFKGVSGRVFNLDSRIK